MKTKSEVLFSQYCESVHYVCKEIPAGSQHGKTADYEVLAGNSRIVVEIKELTPDSEDKRQARELIERGWTSGGGRPGSRVQTAIKRAAPQLKKYRRLGIPLVLVLYDNIVVNGTRPHARNGLLESSFIDFAMYGLQTEFFKKISLAQGFVLEHSGSGRGGKRQTTETERTYMSAVCVLYENDPGPPFLYTYHNFFAEVRLPFHIFSGPEDQHFRKPGSPDKTPQEWEAVDRRTDT